MKTISMTCEEFVREVSGLWDNELSGPDDARAQEHLTACQKCRTYLRGYEITIELAKCIAADGGGTDPLPEFLVQRILSKGRRG